jgi:hypothetical protein
MMRRSVCAYETRLYLRSVDCSSSVCCEDRNVKEMQRTYQDMHETCMNRFTKCQSGHYSLSLLLLIYACLLVRKLTFICYGLDQE